MGPKNNYHGGKHVLLLGSGYIVVGLFAIFILYFLCRAVMSYHKISMSAQCVDYSAFGIAKPDAELSINGVAIEWPVLVETSEGTIQAMTKSINLFGAFIACPEPFEINKELGLKIAIPNREPVEIDAKVTWNNRHAEETTKLVRGMGVNFVRISNEDRLFIKDAILGKNRETESDDWFVEC